MQWRHFKWGFPSNVALLDNNFLSRRFPDIFWTSQKLKGGAARAGNCHIPGHNTTDNTLDFWE